MTDTINNITTEDNIFSRLFIVHSVLCEFQFDFADIAKSSRMICKCACVFSLFRLKFSAIRFSRSVNNVKAFVKDTASSTTVACLLSMFLNVAHMPVNVNRRPR